MGITKVRANQVFGLPTLPSPKLNVVIPDSYLPNNTGNFILEGAYFTEDMVISISGGNTINSVTFINDNKIILNITTSANEGAYTITLNNGKESVYPESLLIVLGEVFTPESDDFEKITNPVDLSDKGSIKIAAENTLGEAKVKTSFFSLPGTKDFELQWKFAKSPLSPFPVNSNHETQVLLKRVSDDATVYRIPVYASTGGYSNSRCYAISGNNLLFDLPNPHGWVGLTFKFRRVNGACQLYTGEQLRGSLSYSETEDMYIQFDVKKIDISNIKIIVL